MNIGFLRVAVAALLAAPLAPGWGQVVARPAASRQSPGGEDRGGALAQPLAPGDAIQLAFSREPDLGGDFPVDENGAVILPLLGTRTVTQESAAELKRTLLAEYAQQIRNQDVRITLLRRVRILGAVKNPGLYRVDPTMTVVDAVALAGGATEQGKLQNTRVYRDGKEIGSHIDINAELLPQVHSGDQIVVPERSWFARNGVYVLAAGISAAGIIVARAVP